MLKRFLLAFLAPALLIALPVLLQPEKDAADEVSGDHDTLVVVSPHTAQIQYEFERGFRKYYKEKTGRNVKIDWRNVGGTSDITRYIEDSYTASFRQAWEKAGHTCTEADKKAFKDNKSDSEARKFFLASDCGIGIDIFFGGGSFEHSNTAKKGFAVDGGVQTRHPEYLTDIPQTFSGETIWDKNGLFYGCCLSSFGLAYNPDRFNDAGLTPPTTWNDLTRPELFNQIGLADPTKSGSIMKCYEMILQQAMAEYPGDPERGWREGFRRIKLIAANARTITDSAGKLVRDVSTGSVMAGMCIDFYGFSESEWTAKTTGAPRLIYHMPQNGSAVTCDPVQLLRGAPNRAVAEHFLDYLVSPEGQRLWIQKPGTPGGPQKHALLRTSVKQGFHKTIPAEYLNNPDFDPYDAAGTFQYDGRLTGRYFSLIRVLIKCIALDPQNDLSAARKAMRNSGDPAWAMEELLNMPFTYAEAGEMAKKLSGGNAQEKAALRREWTAFALDQYRKIRKECEK